MKKTLLILLTLVLATAALAETPSAKLFSYAENALTALAAGDYEKIVASLPFAGASPDASEWAKFANCFDTLDGASPSGALAYRNGDVWNIAVRLHESNDDDTEIFILTSEGGSTFTGYRYATLSQVKRACADADEIVRK